jgi:hypothetical protein
VSDGDETGSVLSCLLFGARGCMRSGPTMPGIQCRCLSLEDLASVALPVPKARVWLLGVSGLLQTGLTRRVYDKRTGCEIMSVHACRDETEDQYVSLSDLILFRLMAPPLQPGEMESYLIWGV